MVGFVLAGYVIGVMIAVVGVWLLVRRRPGLAGPFTPRVRALLVEARRRALIAVVFSGAVGVALCAAASFFDGLVGLPFALVPALSGTAGLLLYSARPPRVAAVESTSEREASLTPRTPLSYLPRSGALVLVAVVVAQVAFLIFTGVTSSADEAGRHRVIAFSTGSVASASSPYAGWFYAVPLLLATVTLVGATFLALWRVSSTPALPQREDSEVDVLWRRATNRILVAISAAAVLLQFGGVSILSGMSLRNAFFEGVPSWWDATGLVFLGGGALMLIGSVATVTLAALWALTLPERALTPGSAAATRDREEEYEEVAP